MTREKKFKIYYKQKTNYLSLFYKYPLINSHKKHSEDIYSNIIMKTRKKMNIFNIMYDQ